jgi:uncharacterized protein (TIGR03382 family)
VRSTTLVVLAAGLVTSAGTATASADVVVNSRLSHVIADAFCGNGPVGVQYHDEQTTTALLSGPDAAITHLTLFNDPFWGSSSALTDVQQHIGFIDNGLAGFRVDGRLDVNVSQTTLIAPSQNGANALAQGQTDSIFEYVWTVTAPTAWSITVDATRVPNPDFAVSIQDVNTLGAIYIAPLSAPINDAAGGVLGPGTYKLRARAWTFSNGGGAIPGVPGTDSVHTNFVLDVGEVPAPSAAAVAGLAGLAAVGRRRRR